MGKQFTVNYGGPGTAWTTLPSQYEKVLESCVKKYTGGSEATKFTVNGLNVTVFGTGIHRGIKVELPDSVEQALKSSNHQHKQAARVIQKRFLSAKAKASDFNTKDYSLWSNNCVSAVSNVLHTIDPTFAAKQTKPWELDKEVKSKTTLFRKFLKVLNIDSKVKSTAVETTDLSAPPAPPGVWDSLDVKQQLQQQKVEAQLDNSAQDSTVEEDAKKTF